MSRVGIKIIDDSKAGGGKKKQSLRVIEKGEITSTEFPEGGNTTFTKGLPASQQGEFLGHCQVQEQTTIKLCVI